MGWLRLRRKHIDLARDDCNLNAKLDCLNSAEKMIAHYDALAKGKKLKVLPKSSFFGPNFAKMTTTYWNQIRLGKNFSKYSLEDQAAIWAHEFVHVEQWERYGVIKFAGLYLGARHSWAFEMQAYRESVRAKKALGYSSRDVQEFINRLPKSIWKGYPLMRQIRWNDFKKQTLYTLRKEL